MLRPITRRAFSTIAAGLAARAEISLPQLILHNANIYTVDSAQPRAQAVAITGGKFVAVGSRNEILPLAGAQTKLIDLGGKTVVPGFIDAHSHPASSGLRHLREVDCDLRSITAIQEAIRARGRMDSRLQIR
jgi:predicted amidohydrolase YtcJ